MAQPGTCMYATMAQGTAEDTDVAELDDTVDLIERMQDQHRGMRSGQSLNRRSSSKRKSSRLLKSALPSLRRASTTSEEDDAEMEKEFELMHGKENKRKSKKAMPSLRRASTTSEDENIDEARPSFLRMSTIALQNTFFKRKSGYLYAMDSAGDKDRKPVGRLSQIDCTGTILGLDTEEESTVSTGGAKGPVSKKKKKKKGLETPSWKPWDVMGPFAIVASFYFLQWMTGFAKGTGLDLSTRRGATFATDVLTMRGFGPAIYRLFRDRPSWFKGNSWKLTIIGIIKVHVVLDVLGLTLASLTTIYFALQYESESVSAMDDPTYKAILIVSDVMLAIAALLTLPLAHYFPRPAKEEGSMLAFYGMAQMMQRVDLFLCRNSTGGDVIFKRLFASLVNSHAQLGRLIRVAVCAAFPVKFQDGSTIGGLLCIPLVVLWAFWGANAASPLSGEYTEGVLLLARSLMAFKGVIVAIEAFRHTWDLLSSSEALEGSVGELGKQGTNSVSKGSKKPNQKSSTDIRVVTSDFLLTWLPLAYYAVGVIYFENCATLWAQTVPILAVLKSTLHRCDLRDIVWDIPVQITHAGATVLFMVYYLMAPENPLNLLLLVASCPPFTIGRFVTETVPYWPKKGNLNQLLFFLDFWHEITVALVVISAFLVYRSSELV